MSDIETAEGRLAVQNAELQRKVAELQDTVNELRAAMNVQGLRAEARAAAARAEASGYLKERDENAADALRGLLLEALVNEHLSKVEVPSLYTPDGRGLRGADGVRRLAEAYAYAKELGLERHTLLSQLLRRTEPVIDDDARVAEIARSILATWTEAARVR